MLTDYDGARFDGLPNVTTQQWADEQAGFLAGVAAATTTETGTVGFLGADPTGGDQEDYRAGFEAGVESIDPDIAILAVYLAGLRVPAEPLRRTRRAVETWPVCCTSRSRRDLPRRRPLRSRRPRRRLGPQHHRALGDRGGAGPLAGGDHTATAAHPDVDRQPVRRRRCTG